MNLPPLGVSAEDAALGFAHLANVLRTAGQPGRSPGYEEAARLVAAPPSADPPVLPAWARWLTWVSLSTVPVFIPLFIYSIVQGSGLGLFGLAATCLGVYGSGMALGWWGPAKTQAAAMIDPPLSIATLDRIIGIALAVADWAERLKEEKS